MSDLSTWASGGTVRPPTAAELSSGFECGIADPDLFNYLVQELGKCCPPEGVSTNDVIYYDDVQEKWINAGTVKQRYAEVSANSLNDYTIGAFFGASTFLHMPINAFGQPFVGIAPALGLVHKENMPNITIDGNGMIVSDKDCILQYTLQHRMVINDHTINGVGLVTQCRLLKNGARVLLSDNLSEVHPEQPTNLNKFLTAVSSSGIVELSAGDTLSISERCYHHSGSPSPIGRKNAAYLTLALLPMIVEPQ